jgi:hypothetical protein
MGQGREWSRKEVGILWGLREKGFTFAKIALVLMGQGHKRTQQACSAKYTRLYISRWDSASRCEAT